MAGGPTKHMRFRAVLNATTGDKSLGLGSDALSVLWSPFRDLVRPQ